MIRTETVEAGKLARAVEIGDRLSRLVDARHNYPCPVGVSFNGDGPPATVGINLNLLAPLAKRFDKGDSLTMGIKDDGSTTVEHGRSAYTLNATAPLNDRGAMLYVVPFARLLELAEEKGRATEIARKLAVEIGAEVPEKVAKPSKVEALRAKEAQAVEKIATMEAELHQAGRFARIDTAPLERAERLYTERVGTLLSALRLMQGAVYKENGSIVKSMDAANRETALGILAGLAQALPVLLMDQARAVFDIPAAHVIKRLTAAGRWFLDARSWIARAMGGQASGVGFDARPAYIRGSFRRMDAGMFCPPYMDPRDRAPQRLTMLYRARGSARRMADIQERLAAARCELSRVRGLLTIEDGVPWNRRDEAA